MKNLVHSLLIIFALGGLSCHEKTAYNTKKNQRANLHANRHVISSRLRNLQPSENKTTRKNDNDIYTKVKSNCYLIIEAMPTPVKVKFKKFMYVGNVPAIEGLPQRYTVENWPIMIPDSCNKLGYCLWRVKLDNYHCVVAKSLPVVFGKTEDKEFEGRQYSFDNAIGIGGVE